jgi:ribosomal protein S4
MDHRYLARYDGSEMAAGRGMGADSEETKRGPQMTPYMQMTYYPLERRLDTAIFRALFASSVRQARQFVVHGLVKVNGKKVHPRSSSTTAWTR